jgi:hypothetical protein
MNTINEPNHGSSTLGGNESFLTFDSVNVRKTTQLGVRSSGFFLSKDAAASKPLNASKNMAYKKVSNTFDKIAFF